MQSQLGTLLRTQQESAWLGVLGKPGPHCSFRSKRASMPFEGKKAARSHRTKVWVWGGSHLLSPSPSLSFPIHKKSPGFPDEPQGSWAQEKVVNPFSSSRGFRRKSASTAWTGTGAGSRRLRPACCMSGSSSACCGNSAGPWTAATSAWPGSSIYSECQGPQVGAE